MTVNAVPTGRKHPVSHFLPDLIAPRFTRAGRGQRFLLNGSVQGTRKALREGAFGERNADVL